MWFATKPVHKKLFLEARIPWTRREAIAGCGALERLPGSTPDSFATYVKTEG